MTKQLLFIIVFLLTKNVFSQTDDKLLIGELTINQTTLNKVKVGDTLTFLFAKKHFAGSIKIHSDNSIYAWTTCVLGQNKYSWCKIGTWDKKKFVVFNLTCKTIILKNISPYIGLGQQKLVIQDIK
jgi:hypothetical protein